MNPPDSIVSSLSFCEANYISIIKCKYISKVRQSKSEAVVQTTGRIVG